MWNSPRGTHPRKRCVSVGAAYGRPRADEDIGPYTRKAARPAVHRPRCMLHHLGVLHLVEAGGFSTEESGSDNLLTPFMMAPRRPELPAKQRNSPGSGPAGPENFGYFPSLESSPPAGGISPKTKQRFRRCGGEFLSERSERNQRIAGCRGVWERPAAYASVFQEPRSPGPPILRGEPEGCVGNRVRRGALMNGV